MKCWKFFKPKRTEQLNHHPALRERERERDRSANERTYLMRKNTESNLLSARLSCCCCCHSCERTNEEYNWREKTRENKVFHIHGGNKKLTREERGRAKREPGSAGCRRGGKMASFGCRGEQSSAKNAAGKAWLRFSGNCSLLQWQHPLERVGQPTLPWVNQPWFVFFQ